MGDIGTTVKIKFPAYLWGIEMVKDWGIVVSDKRIPSLPMRYWNIDMEEYLTLLDNSQPTYEVLKWC